MELTSLHDHIVHSGERFCMHVAKGFRAAFYYWQLVDASAFKQWSAEVSEVFSTDDELRDHPFFPYLSLMNEAEVRERESDLVENADYGALSQQWTELGGLECPLNAREIRIELALRLRAKIGDYAGMWWPESAAMWSGYLVALHSQGVLNERDARYLFKFLPPTFQKWTNYIKLKDK